MENRGEWSGADIKLVEFEVSGVSGGYPCVQHRSVQLMEEGRVCRMWKEKENL